MRKTSLSIKSSTLIFRLFFIAWFLWLCYYFILFLSEYFDCFNYETCELSDWMINYSGGFVRRGLIGEILLSIYEIQPYPIRNAIAYIIILSFGILLFSLIRLFNKEGWSHMILLSPFMIIHLMFLSNMGMRRDFIALLITWCIFYFYNKYKHTLKQKSFIIMQALSILTLLMYEASFFFTFPILYLNYFLHIKDTYPKLMNRLIKTILFFSPSIITMALVCLFKGNAEISTAIWQSWQHCINCFPTGTHNSMGEAVSFLSMGIIDTAKLHLNVNFNNIFWNSIPGFPFTLANIILIYYLVTRVNTVDLKWNTSKLISTIRLSNILIIQFISLLPMFTILSCDWGRTLPYWIISSLIAYHYFKKDNIATLPSISAISFSLQKGINRIHFLKNPYVYLFILFAIPIPFYRGSTFYSSNLYRIFHNIEQFIEILI